MIQKNEISIWNKSTQKPIGWLMRLLFCLFDAGRAPSWWKCRTRHRRAWCSSWNWRRRGIGAGRAPSGANAFTSRCLRASSKPDPRKGSSPCSSTPKRSCCAATSSWRWPKTARIATTSYAPSCSSASPSWRPDTRWSPPIRIIFSWRVVFNRSFCLILHPRLLFSFYYYYFLQYFFNPLPPPPPPPPPPFNSTASIV